MALVKDLTKLTVEDLWREVKDEVDWWGDLKEEVVRVVKRLLESAMEEEMVEQLRAGWSAIDRVNAGCHNLTHYINFTKELLIKDDEETRTFREER